MGIRTIEANQWLVVQSDLPAYFLHKLIKGRVGIYEDGEKIDTVEVNEGMKPKLLNIISTLAKDHKRRTAVKTETEVKVDTAYQEHFWKLLSQEVPHDILEKVEKMIEAILIGDHVKSLRRKLSKLQVIEPLVIQETFNSEVTDLLVGIEGLYEHIMNDPECRERT